MTVLLAMADHDLRESLTLWLEGAGCEVIAVDRRLAAITSQPWNTRPVVFALDAYLGDAATEQILALATSNAARNRHQLVILSTLSNDLWPERLVRFVRGEHPPVLQLPTDLDLLVPTVMRLRAIQHAALTCCGAGAK